MGNVANILGQLILLALIMERAVAVLRTIAGKPGDSNRFTTVETVCVLVVAWLVLWTVPFDVLQKIFEKVEHFSPYPGITLGAFLVAGGSAGLKQFSLATGKVVEAWKAESDARLAFVQKQRGNPSDAASQ